MLSDVLFLELAHCCLNNVSGGHITALSPLCIWEYVRMFLPELRANDITVELQNVEARRLLAAVLVWWPRTWSLTFTGNIFLENISFQYYLIISTQPRQRWGDAARWQCTTRWLLNLYTTQSVTPSQKETRLHKPVGRSCPWTTIFVTTVLGQQSDSCSEQDI